MERKVRDILLIDDDKISLTINKMLIRKFAPDIEVVDIKDVTMAQGHFTKNINDWPAIVFLDVNMPKMSGWQFLDSIEERLKKNGDQVLICMLSSSNDETDLGQFHRRDYVSCYLQKPLLVDHIYHIVNQAFDMA